MNKHTYTLAERHDLLEELHRRESQMIDVILHGHHAIIECKHPPESPVATHEWVPAWLLRERHEARLANDPNTPALVLPSAPKMPQIFATFEDPTGNWPDAWVARMTDHAHQQLCTRLSVPIRLARRTATYYPELYERMINTWITHNESTLLLRLSLGEMGMTVRSLASSRYLRFDNKHMVEAAIVACELLESKPEECVMVFSSDADDMRVDARSAKGVTGEDGLTFSVGATLENSEVGRSAIKLTPFLYIGLGDGLYLSLGASNPWTRRHVTAVRSELGVVEGDDPAIPLIVDKIGRKLYETVAHISFDTVLDVVGRARATRPLPLLNAEALVDLCAVTADIGETITACVAAAGAALSGDDRNSLFHAACAVAWTAQLLSYEHPERPRLMRFAWSIMGAGPRSKILVGLSKEPEMAE